MQLNIHSLLPTIYFRGLNFDGKHPNHGQRIQEEWTSNVGVGLNSYSLGPPLSTLSSIDLFFGALYYGPSSVDFILGLV